MKKSLNLSANSLGEPASGKVVVVDAPRRDLVILFSSFGFRQPPVPFGRDVMI